MRRNTGIAPRCFICELRHWASEDCPDGWEQAKEQGEESGQGSDERDVVTDSAEQDSEGVSAEALRKRRWRAKNKEKQRAYNREYMKDWRDGKRRAKK